jgi:hypothetical protein
VLIDDLLPGRQRPLVLSPVSALLRFGQDFEGRQQCDVSQVELGHRQLRGDPIGGSPRGGVDCHRHVLIS